MWGTENGMFRRAIKCFSWQNGSEEASFVWNQEPLQKLYTQNLPQVNVSVLPTIRVLPGIRCTIRHWLSEFHKIGNQEALYIDSTLSLYNFWFHTSEFIV